MEKKKLKKRKVLKWPWFINHEPKFAWLAKLVSNLIPKKTKKIEFRKKIAAILFEVKNNAYTQILNLVGVGVGVK